jgi:splicing factor 3B subunit 3
MGDRIFVGDLQESFHFMRYKRAENSLYIYADDIVPRHVTSGLLMDYDTMAGGDKFGNFFMTRLPAETSAQVKPVRFRSGFDQ